MAQPEGILVILVDHLVRPQDGSIALKYAAFCYLKELEAQQDREHDFNHESRPAAAADLCGMACLC